MGNRLIYKDRSIFGFDIGRSSIKVMQIDWSDKLPVVTGYGSTKFNPDAIVNGRVVDPIEIAKQTYGLFAKELVGQITTKRAAISLPNEHSFSRIITLPKMDQKRLLQP
ncbi:hypothetical protein IPO96_03035 [Candidatus Saccharibacteria bacterium]|nr:MAG: hypothetical protein IPO96_03035 [Candidatus Saccharibacteria bacterium]